MTSPDYNAAFLTFIEQIKLDKGIVQPWRNKAIGRIQEAEAFIRMGLTTTYEQPPADVCTCPPGGIKRTCPVHGEGI